MKSFFLKSTDSNIEMTQGRCDRRAPLILAVWLGLSLWVAPVQASTTTVTIIDTWVEDGFLFHVEFEAQPANAGCELTGEGLIEFEVTYNPQTSSETASVFGVAIWYPNSETKEWINTEGKAMGPQAFCTSSSPCRIQEVNIVKTWCPVSNESLFSW
ncbi:MAG: hypothetical protein OEY57_08855 [Nitrospirota bacterium]|nr:hypothetical protein [Nitrospirota bacterium]